MLPRANAAEQGVADQEQAGQREPEHHQNRAVMPFKQLVVEIQERGRGHQHKTAGSRCYRSLALLDERGSGICGGS